MPATLPGSTNMLGDCFATPDTCLTPTNAGPVPVVYPNTAMCMQALLFALKVKFVMKEVLTLQSVIPMSTGDEGGSNGGVMSAMFKGPVQFKRGSAKVFVEGKPCEYHTAMTGHNGINSNMPAGAQISPSQPKVLVSM